MNDARERAATTRQLINLFNWGAANPRPPTAADVAEFPAEYHKMLLEEIAGLRKMYADGNRGGVRQRALLAAQLFVQAYGPGADTVHEDPRQLAALIRGEEIPTDPTRLPQVSGGSDPTAEPEPDLRELLARIPR